MKVPRIGCKLCARRIEDTWAAKWQHVIRYHPDEAFGRLLPLMFNPEACHEIGADMAARLTRRLFRKV